MNTITRLLNIFLFNYESFTYYSRLTNNDYNNILIFISAYVSNKQTLFTTKNSLYFRKNGITNEY